jgi:hypothetical protein
MKKHIAAAVLVAAGGSMQAEARALLPEKEAIILERVAGEYHLGDEQAALLVVIRLIENGKNGREMGVETKEAMRFAGDFDKSLELQAAYAAGTIVKRYRGDVKTFARTWCPVNRWNWEKMAKSLMKKAGVKV